MPSKKYQKKETNPERKKAKEADFSIDKSSKKKSECQIQTMRILYHEQMNDSQFSVSQGSTEIGSLKSQICDVLS